MATVKDSSLNGVVPFGTDPARGTSLRDVTGQGLVTVTPADGSLLPQFIRKLIVTTGGTLHFLDNEGVDRTVTVPAGTFECVMTKVFSTGTSASGLIGVL
jgi:hypothetical protein